MFYFILHFKMVYQCLFVAVAFAIVCVINGIGLFKLPWNIDSALWGMLYMFLGYNLKNIDFPEKIRKQKLLWTVLAIGLLTMGSFAAFANDVEG